MPAPSSSLLPEIPSSLLPAAPEPDSQGPLPLDPGGTAVAAPEVQPDSCSVLQNTDFYGGDLPDTRFPSTDPLECCNACLANPDCYVWTLSIVLNSCFLKGQAGWQQRLDMTCCLSGTTNRGGIVSFIPGTIDPNADADDPDEDNNNGNGGGGGVVAMATTTTTTIIIVIIIIMVVAAGAAMATTTITTTMVVAGAATTTTTTTTITTTITTTTIIMVMVKAMARATITTIRTVVCYCSRRLLLILLLLQRNLLERSFSSLS